MSASPELRRTNELAASGFVPTRVWLQPKVAARRECEYRPISEHALCETVQADLTMHQRERDRERQTKLGIDEGMRRLFAPPGLCEHLLSLPTHAYERLNQTGVDAGAAPEDLGCLDVRMRASARWPAFEAQLLDPECFAQMLKQHIGVIGAAGEQLIKAGPSLQRGIESSHAARGELHAQHGRVRRKRFANGSQRRVGANLISPAQLF